MHHPLCHIQPVQPSLPKLSPSFPPAEVGSYAHKRGLKGSGRIADLHKSVARAVRTVGVSDAAASAFGAALPCGSATCYRTANPRTTQLDFKGFYSNIFLFVKEAGNCGFPMTHKKHSRGSARKVNFLTDNCYFDRVPNYEFGPEIYHKDATDAKPLAISTSPQPESNGRHVGPGFGKTS